MAELPDGPIEEDKEAHAPIVMRTAKQTWVQRTHEARLSRLTRTLGGRYDVTVKLNDKNMACTDGNTVWLPRQLDENPAANLVMQEAIAAHEAAGHLRYTDFKAWIKMSEGIQNGTVDNTLHHFVNIIEDARINWLLSQDYKGSGIALQFTTDKFMPKYEENFGDNEKGREQNPRLAALAMTAVECIANHKNMSPLPEVEAFLAEVRPLFKDSISQPNTTAVIKTSQEVLEVYRKHFPTDGSSEMAEQQFGSGAGEGLLVDEHDIDNLKNMKRLQSRVKVNRKVSKKRYEDMKTSGNGKDKTEAPPGDDKPGDGKPGDDKPGNCNSDGDSGEPSDGDDDGQPDESGDGSGLADGGEERPWQTDEEGDAFAGSIQESGTKDGSTAPAEGAWHQKNQEVETEEYWELLSSVEDDIKEMNYDAIEMEEEFSAVREASDGGLQVDPRGQGFLDKWGHEIGIIGTPSTIVNDYNFGDNLDRYNRVIKRYEREIRTLVAELKRKLAGRESDYQRYQRRGQVDSRSVWNMDSTDRIFRKRSRIKKPHAAGVMLIDASGSMGCANSGGQNRAYYATEAAIVLAEVMARCNFDFEVVDFNSDNGGRGGYGYTSMNVRKPLGGQPTDISKAAIAQDHVGYCNGDGFAVQWCIDKVQTIEADARFVFVISDGAPAGPHPEGMNCHSHLKGVVDDCPKDVELFSVGIAGCRTSTFYGDRACDIRGTAEVAEKVVPVMRKALRNIKRKVLL